MSFLGGLQKGRCEGSALGDLSGPLRAFFHSASDNTTLEQDGENASCKILTHVHLI